MAINPTQSTAWNYGNWGTSWFENNNLYGGSTDQTTSPIVSGFGGFLEDPSNYDASWLRYATELGYDPNTSRGRWMRSQLPQASEGYRAALSVNPQLRFNEYIRGIDVNGMFNSMTAQQRGENPGQYAPRARTISRGY